MSLPPEAAAAGPDARIGKFICTQRLGRGGMGEVWQAWDTELNRWVALKFVLAAQDLARFRREAQTAAGLIHPNIAAIYDIDEAGGRPYIAMQFVDGQTLRAVPRDDPRRLAELVRDAALAVQAAHERGVVHRDLKPENLMVDRGGRLFVMDFGLARSTAVDSSLSASGMAVGTPAYMAPEQARGEVRATDARSDVYGLGATLYELLAGRAPFEGSDAIQILMKVVQDDPAPLRPGIDRDLETIVMKCLEKEPARRYPTARALADDLSRWLSAEPITARPISGVERFVRRVRRNKVVTVALTALVLLAIAAAAGFAWQQSRASQEIARQRGWLIRLNSHWNELLERKRRLRALRVPAERGREELEASVKAIDALIAETPDRPQGWYLRARGRLYLGRLDDAAADATRAVEAAPDFKPGWTLRGMIGMERLHHLVVGTARTVDERERERRAIGGQTAADLERGAGDAAAEAARWDLPHTAEDSDLARLAPILRRFTDGGDAREVTAALDEELARVKTEEAALWRAYFEDPRKQGEALRGVVALAPGYDIARLRLGMHLEHVGNPKGAEDEYTTALRLNPALLAGWVNRGRLRRSLGRLDEARQDAEAAVSLDPKDPSGRTLLGLIVRLQGKPAEALAIYEAVLADWPGHPSAIVGRASSLEDLGRLDEAMRLYDEAVRTHPEDGSAQVCRALLRQKRGDTDGALADFEAVLARYPMERDALGPRAVLLVRLGRAEEARPDIVKLSSIPLTGGEDLGARAHLRSMIGDLDGALADMSLALERGARRGPALRQRSRIQVLRGDFRAALNDADAALEEDPRSPEGWVLRSHALDELERFPESLRSADEAVRLGPTSVDALVCRARAKRHMGNAAGAAADLEAALRLDPDSIPALEERGHARIDGGDPRGAVDDLRRVLKGRPFSARAHQALGAALLGVGDLQGALRAYDHAIELMPDATQYSNRALVKWQMQDLDGARADFAESVRLAPQDATVRFNRGTFFSETGDGAAAEADLTEAVRLRPAYPEAWGNLGNLRLRARDWKGAIAAYDEATRLRPTWPDPLFYRAVARANAGDRAGAQRDFEAVLRVAPKDWPRRAETEALLARLRK